MRKKDDFAKTLLLNAALALFGVALAEAGAQVLFYAKFRAWPYPFATENFYQPIHLYMTDHPYLPYLATKGVSGSIRFNSLGDRGPEPDSPKRRVRVVCYGGSTTFDGSHPEETTWPGRLQALLGPRYEVINAAQNGATSADTLVNFALIHADLKPDFVLALEGINDLESSYYPGFRADYAHRRRKVSGSPYPIFDRLPRVLNASALYVILRWKAVGPRGDLHALYSRPGRAYDFKSGPVGLPTFERNLRELDALAKAAGAKVVLGTPPYYREKARAFGDDFADGWQKGIDAENALVRALPRRSANITIADLASGWKPGDDVMVDFCHFTERGNESVARAFYDAVRRAEGRR